MRRMRGGWQGSGVAGLLGLMLVGGAAEAALKTSPSRVVLRAKPGQALVGKFQLMNEGEEALAVMVEPEDWNQGIGGSRGEVDWLSVRPRRLTLKPGQRAKVTYRVDVPEGAKGELRAQVFFTTQQQEGAAPIRSRQGSIIYVTIEGTIQLEAELLRVRGSYAASTPGARKPDRLELALDIRNKSNAHLVPAGDVQVTDTNGQVVAQIPIRSGWGLLPREEDTYHAVGNGVYLQPGRYTVTVTVNYGDDVGQPKSLTRILEAVLTNEYKFTLHETPSLPLPSR